MDIGLPVKVIYVPLPQQVPTIPEEKPIEAPNWPIRVPVKEPARAE